MQKKTAETIVMGKLGATVTKLLAPVDKYGELIGAGAVAYEKRDAIILEAQRIAQGHIHFPNIKNLTGNILAEKSFQTGVAAALGGMVLEAIGIHPVLNRVGTVAKKIGTGMALALVVENTVGYSTNSDEQPYHSWSKNTSSQPVQANYGY